MHRDTEMLRNLFVPVGSALNPFQSGHATLLKLNAGVVGRLPARHTASLPIHTYAVINKVRLKTVRVDLLPGDAPSAES